MADDQTTEIVRLTELETRRLENGWIERDYTGIRLAVERILADRLAQMTMIAAVNGGLHRDAEREIEELTARVAALADHYDGDDSEDWRRLGVPRSIRATLVRHLPAERDKPPGVRADRPGGDA